MSAFAEEERQLEERDLEDADLEYAFEKNDVPMSRRYPQCGNPTDG